eukprot:8128783-Pyramimonas_sp.AAC.1
MQVGTRTSGCRPSPSARASTSGGPTSVQHLERDHDLLGDRGRELLLQSGQHGLDFRARVVALFLESGWPGCS